jgi:hypothetical protein
LATGQADGHDVEKGTERVTKGASPIIGLRAQAQSWEKEPCGSERDRDPQRQHHADVQTTRSHQR